MEKQENNAAKRRYVESGATPNKPARQKKRLDSTTRSTSTRSSRRGLNFQQESVSPKARPSCISHLRGVRQSPSGLLKSPKRTKIPWLRKENVALIQFVALHKDLQSSNIEWPAFNTKAKYWIDAAAYVKETASTGYIRNGTSVRQRVVVFFKGKYKTIEEAEDDYGITSDTYLGCDNQNLQPTTELTGVPDKIKDLLQHLSETQLVQLVSRVSHMIKDKQKIIKSITKEFASKVVSSIIRVLYQALPQDNQGSLLNGLYLEHAEHAYGIDTTPGNFGTLSLKAMKNLQMAGKPNLVYKWCTCLSGKDGKTMLSTSRMPFVLIQYCIEFFSCTHTAQITEAPDYKLWLDTMEAEFGGGKFKRLFRGPMWSGCERGDFGHPEKAKTNIPCVSTQAQLRATSKSEFSTKPEIQIEAIKQLKHCNPNGRYWIKADGTDLKPALQESMRREWNGDVDLLDGELDKLRAEYDNRLLASEAIKKCSMNRADLQLALLALDNNLAEDVNYLHKGLLNAVQSFRKKFDAPNTPVEKLKSLNWEIVEFHTLLEQATTFKEVLQSILSELDPLESMAEDLKQALEKSSGKKPMKQVMESWGNGHVDYMQYLRNLFKKKRKCATHILVFMLSDEQRNKKPYAIPVQYVPYNSIRDQEVRDLTKQIKVEMTKAGLTVVGTSTDGEFEQLRRRGTSRPLHVWQLAHDARDSVSKMSKTTLLQMLEMQRFDANQLPVVTRPNPAIPPEVIAQLAHLRFQQGMTLVDAVTYIRGKLVPDGYTPNPFRRDTPESLLDKLRSLIATYQFRADVTYWKERGVDFTLYCYCPEVDPDTGKLHHERADHNHILKRLAKHTRDGGNNDLTYEGFDEAMRNPHTGLTHAALVGQRKQSVPDAEKLLSFHVAKFFRDKGYGPEAEYVETIAQWHEASDGRGISQLQRCRQNYRMLNFILDEWIPWHRDNYDLSSLDINRPIAGIRGFSRESVIEVTTNIESQEHRRRQNHEIGHQEHPRAGSTDDLECFFAMCHSWLGPVFTLKEFKHKWRKIVREYTKRMDPELPFYYHTLNERFSADLLPSFDDTPPGDDDDDSSKNPYRLKRLKQSTREDGSIFAAGRSFLPARNRTTVRQRFHAHDVGLPPVLHQAINAIYGGGV